MKYFYYPKSNKWVTLALIFFLVVISISGIFLLFNALYKNFFWGLIFSPLFLFPLIVLFAVYTSYKQSDSKIFSDNSGIHVIAKDGSKQSIYWVDIFSIKRGIMEGRIILKNRSGNTLLKIDHQLIGFDNLYDIILSKTGISDELILKKQFATSWEDRGLFIFSAIVFGCAAIFSYYHKERYPHLYLFSFFNGGISIFSILLYLWEVKRITLNETSLTIKNIFTRKTIKYTDIDNVLLKKVRHYKGSTYTVFLILKDKKPIEIAGMQGGIDAVYGSIKNAWEKSRQISSDSTVIVQK